jgi:hypothetical protein
MSRVFNELRHGSKVAEAAGMNAIILAAVLLLILCAPGRAIATGLAPGVTQATTNVNTRYDVESATLSGIRQSSVSQGLRDDMQKLVGRKYDPDAAEAIARRLRDELDGYRVSVKVRRGDEAEHLKVIFLAERVWDRRFDLRGSPLLFTNEDGFSLSLVPSFETHHNVFSFGYVTDANDLLERNTGWVVRYENRNVGTSAVQVGVEYDYFHPSFQPETEAALIATPVVPGIYRTREVFAPSISVLPVRDIKLTFGASFQTLNMQYPMPYDQAAHAFTFGAQYRKEARPRHGLRHSISIDYGLRDGTSHLESDFRYTRQRVAGDYTLGVAHHEFAWHFEGGHLSGAAPLFERFSIGSATTLRGWDKFDVAPAGGSRLLYGSLAYRYRPLELFYDFGTAWDPALGQSADWKHSVGIGVTAKSGFFMSIGVPCRFHGVTPVFLFGLRLQGRG